MELKDYSGPFNPDLKFEDLSKDLIIKLIRQYSDGYLQLGNFWLYRVAEKVGLEKALLEDAADVWIKQPFWFLPRIAKAANIEVKDIVDAMKVWQLMLDGPLTGRYKNKIEVINRNHVIWTVVHCADLVKMQQNNMTDAIKWICGDVPNGENVDMLSIRAYIQCLVPNAQLKQLYGPPGSGLPSKEGIACQWEYTLKPE